MSHPKADSRRLARLFQALAQPTRLRIFSAVRERSRMAEAEAAGVGGTRDGGIRVGDLYALVNVAPSTVSHHLAALTRAGLVVERRRGTFVHLTVGAAAVAELARFAVGITDGAPGAPVPRRPRRRRQPPSRQRSGVPELES